MWIQVDEDGRILGLSFEEPEPENAHLWQQSDLTKDSFEHNFDDYILKKDGTLEASPREGGNWWREIQEQVRPLTAEEIWSIVLPYLVPDFNAMNLLIPGHTAARMVDKYPKWEAGKTYALLYRVQHEGRLYRCRLANISKASNAPDKSDTHWRLLSPTDTDDDEE